MQLEQLVPQTPPSGPLAFEASEELRKCLAPRLVRSRCSSSAGSSFAGGDTLRRAWAPQAMRPHEQVGVRANPNPNP